MLAESAPPAAETVPHAPPPPNRPDPVAAARTGRIGGALNLLAAAAVFAYLAISSIQRGEPSPVELFFWAMLLIGCARLVGALIRVCTGSLRPSPSL